jgi:hypothetical protein
VTSVGSALVQGIVAHRVVEDQSKARSAHAREDAAFSWVLPTLLLILVGAIGFALAFPRLRKPTCNLRMASETFAIVVVTCLGYAAAWALYWLIEQRW